jgi:SAM-dependent methyltransferase
MSAATVRNEEADGSKPEVLYYGGDRHWNQLAAVNNYLARLSTGDEADWWTRLVKRRWATPPRKRALIVGCGNGWVERDLFDTGIAEQFDAFDASDFWLRDAESKRDGRPINYFLADFRSFEPRGKYDLVVNHAALHHADWLHRAMGRIADSLTDDGVFVNWEYIGATRNQYSPQHAALLNTVNDALGPRFRSKHPLVHSLETLLQGDPSEAVHAREIVGAFEENFETLEMRPLNGGLAYQILWNNVAEFEKGDDEARHALSWLLRMDESATLSGLVPPSFAFFVGRPRRASVRARFDRFVREPLRERISKKTGGLYIEDMMNLALHRGAWAALETVTRRARKA